jgi:hypothetical protein
VEEPIVRAWILSQYMKNVFVSFSPKDSLWINRKCWKDPFKGFEISLALKTLHNVVYGPMENGVDDNSI